MSVVLVPDTQESRKALQEAARHQFILKMYQEIMFDMKVCEIEGWDKMEFIRMLAAVLNQFIKNRKRSVLSFRKKTDGQMSFLEDLKEPS